MSIDHLTVASVRVISIALNVLSYGTERVTPVDRISDLLAQRGEHTESGEPLETIAPLRNPGIE